MSGANEEKGKNRTVSLPVVCALSFAAFLLGAAAAGGVGHAVSRNPVEEADTDGAVGAVKETETSVMPEDVDQITGEQEAQMAIMASEEAEDSASDTLVSEEKRILQEYLDEYILKYDGVVDLGKQAREFYNYQTYTIYCMADGHMAWTNVSGVCGSKICDLDGDGTDELIVFELNKSERMGSGDMSMRVYEVVNGSVDWSKSCSQNLPSDEGGSELSWSFLQADDAAYVFFLDNYHGVREGHASTNEAALYSYAEGHFYSPLRIERAVGEAGNVIYTAYQYDMDAELLSEEIIYDGPGEAVQDSESAHYYKRVAELFDTYGIHLDSEAALENGQSIYHDITEEQGYQSLLTLNMWAVSQGDFHTHNYHLDDQNGSMSVYQRFLNGEESVRIREGVWDEYDGGADEKWTIQDIMNMVCGYYLGDSGRRPYIEYAYLDCGGDGLEELAIRFVGLEMESTEDLTMIIACYGATPEVVYARRSWSRSSNKLRYHGCISYHGSDGALNNYFDMDYIDANGDLQTIYSAHAVGYQGWDLCVLDDYDDTNASEYAFIYTTCSIGDTEYGILDFFEDIPEEICREYEDYLLQEGENIITEETLKGLIEERAKQLGIEKAWVEENDLFWSYCYW